MPVLHAAAWHEFTVQGITASRQDKRTGGDVVVVSITLRYNEPHTKRGAGADGSDGSRQSQYASQRHSPPRSAEGANGGGHFSLCSATVSVGLDGDGGVGLEGTLEGSERLSKGQTYETTVRDDKRGSPAAGKNE